MRSHSSCLFDIGHLLFVDFDLCAPTRLIFLVLVSHYWWTLACAFPFVLSLFDIGHLLLVDFDLCASTCLVILTLISNWLWTLTCALPLALSFSHWPVTVGEL